jgi:hypothetical protein
MNRSLRLLTLGGALCAFLGVTGCSCEESDPPAPNVVVARPQAQPQQQGGRAQQAEDEEEREVGNSVLRAPADYYTTVVVTAPRQMKKDLGNALVGKEVQEFNALEGRYPYSLKELEEWRGTELPEAPKGYTYKYDSAKGEVSIVPID